MNEKLEKILMEQSKENLIKYIDLMFNVIDDLEEKNRELREELQLQTFGKKM